MGPDQFLVKNLNSDHKERNDDPKQCRAYGNTGTAFTVVQFINITVLTIARKKQMGNVAHVGSVLTYCCILRYV
jgi:hypothetical protein